MSLRLDVLPLEQLVLDTRKLAAWRNLSMELPDASYFQTPDWIVSWWETIGGRPAGSAALVWDGARLVGFQAMANVHEQLTGRLPLRIPLLSNAGSGIGTDHAGWLATEGAEEMLVDWIAVQSPLLLKGVPLHVGESVRGRLIDVQRCPRVVVADVPDLMSTKLAKTLRNARRRLAEEGVEFEWKPPGTVDQHDLERLYTLHRLRRSETGDNPIFEEPLRRDFHGRLLEGRGSMGGTAAMLAARDGEVVGVLYGFSWQRTFAYYQIGWDPRHRQLSLGSVLVLEAIEACSRNGIEIFDFLRGAEDYKYRFGATDVVEGTFTIGRSVGLAAIRALNRLRGKPRSVEG